MGRKIEDLLALQDKMNTALGSVDRRLGDLERKITVLESAEQRVIVEAQAAATSAATIAATRSLSELVTRLTIVETKLDGTGGRQRTARRTLQRPDNK